MSRLGTITRRGLLVGSAAIAGGVAFGYWQYRRTPANPLAAGAGETVFNPWVVLTGDGVTVIAPRAEMGQGVQTTLAALVAEEMDMPWDRVCAVHGPAAAAYYNEAVVALGAPFPGYRDSRARDAAQAALGAAGKLLGLQVTGGSTSTVDAFTRMRRAGAAARATLVAAAAARLGVPADRLTTRDGAVIAPGGDAIPYADLAAAAAALDPPADPPLKDPADWALLGRSLPRLDQPAKATGTATYGIDVRLPGLRHAAIRANPRLGGPLLGFDAGPALAIAGVERVLQVGEAVAAIAGDTWTAMRAVDAVDIDWGPAPYPADTEAIFARIEAAFEDGPDTVLRDEGDAAAALGDAGAGDGVLRATYRVPYLAHTTMEPMNATALLDGDRLTVWCGNQAPTILRDHVARAAGVDAADVTVHTPFLGGGFGRRAETDVAVQAARIARAMPGVPVKLTWSREEDVGHDFYRPGAVARMSGRLGADRPRALLAEIAAPSVLRQQVGRLVGIAPPGPSPDTLLLEGAFDQPYAIADFRVAGHVADVGVPVGSWRSVGNSHNAFFLECFLDELAHAGGLDPVAMRLRLVRPEHAASARVIETVAGMCDWGAALPAGHARGMAFCLSYGSPTAQVIEIRDTGRGIALHRIWAAQDVGTALDPRNLQAQLVSGIVYGLSAAIMGEITFADGRVQQANFPDYDALRIDRMPPVETRILSGGGRMGGAGEPGTPPAAPALANAVFALTGQRLRTLPLNRALRFA